MTILRIIKIFILKRQNMEYNIIIVILHDFVKNDKTHASKNLSR